MPAQSSDFGGVFDLDATLSVVTGRTALAQAILRRLSTPRGGLVGTPAYGFDLIQMIGSTVLPMSVVEQRVLEQVLDEEEVEDAAVEASFDAATSTLAITINAVDGDGPFELTINASDVTTAVYLDGTLFAQTEAA